MSLVLWILLAVCTATGAGMVALSRRADRRWFGMTTTVVAAAGLLIVLGADLAAAVWLAIGTAAMLVLRDPAGLVATTPGPALRTALGVPVAMLWAALYMVILKVDWRPLPPQEAVAQTADVAGRLLTADLALLLGAGLLLTVALLAAARLGAKEES